MPDLETDSDAEEERPARRAQQAQQAQRRDEPAPALLPLGDMLLLGAVALGELSRRFLLAVGAPVTPPAPALGGGGAAGGASAGASNHPAAVAAAAERLRSLTAVDAGPGAAREALAVSVCAVWLASHLCACSLVARSEQLIML
jgi:hypothetical protein